MIDDFLALLEALIMGNVLLVDITSRNQLWEVVVNQGVVDSVISEQFFN